MDHDELQEEIQAAAKAVRSAAVATVTTSLKIAGGLDQTMTLIAARPQSVADNHKTILEQVAAALAWAARAQALVD